VIAAVASRVVRGWGRVLGRLTHPSARADLGPGTDGGLGSLRDATYCLLVSRRRDGRPVPTPLWFGWVGDELVFRTDAASPKVGRLRRDPAVVVAPCDLRGRPRGPAVRAVARRVTDPAEELAIERAVGEANGLRGRIWNRLVRISRVEAACFAVNPRPAGS